MKRKDKTPSKLEAPIDKVLAELDMYSPVDPEFATALERLERLMALQQEDNKSNWRKRIDPNTVLSVAGSLLGILAIVEFERTNVATSKALNMVRPHRD